MRRPRTWIVVSVVATTLAAAVITAEVIARTSVTDRLAAAFVAREGLDIGLAPTPALVQLASGHLEVTLAMSDAALGEIAECATELPSLEVATTSAGVALTTARSFHGIDLPVTVLLVPQSTESGWLLAADSVSVAGISIPAARAAAMLDAGGMVARLLGKGITLPTHRSLAVTNIDLGTGRLTLTVHTPLASPGLGGAGKPALGCLKPETPSEGHE